MKPTASPERGYPGGGRCALVAAPEPVLTHEDDESLLSVRPAPAGYELAITRPGLKAKYRVTASRAALFEFAQSLLDGLESNKRLVEVSGPEEGALHLAATVAPGEEGELLLLMIAKQAKGEELEAEYVRFSNRAQMAELAEAILQLA